MTNKAPVQPITIVQRQTVDWQKLSDHQFHQQSIEFCKLWGKPADTVWQYFQLWNETFSTDYREVRQQLKDLSLQNFDSVKNATLIPYRGYINIPPQSGYYLFLDDDDWVDPQIASQLWQQLEKFPLPPHLLLWRSANLGSPNQEHPLFIWGMNGRCMTNNYAVHSDWLQPFSKIQQVIQHKDAEKLFEKNKATPHLDCALTVSNKSPISSVSLDRGLDGDMSREKLIVLVQNYIKRMESIEDQDLVYLPWVPEYIDRVIVVFRGVLAGKR